MVKANSEDVADTVTPIAAANAKHKQRAARGVDKVVMLGATVARLSVGMLTFIILARFLGPEQFGIIASAIAYTTFASNVSDFGFGVSTLRLASAHIEQSERFIGDAIMGKLVLTGVVTLLGSVVAVLVLPTAWLPVFGLVQIGSLANGFGELMLIASRARGRFVLEGKLVITSSILMLLVFGSITALTRDILWAATAFAAGRLLYLAIIRIALSDWFEPVAQMGRSWKELLAAYKRARGFAADGILTVLAGQIDVLLFSALLIAHDFGIYQAGARLSQVFVSFAPVLSAVYLPTLSAAAIKGNDEAFRKTGRGLNIEMAALAFCGGMGFLLIGPWVTPIIYGPKYATLTGLWAGFGAFAMLRFGAAAYGIQLAALGHVRARIISSLSSISFLAILTAIFLPRGGLHVAPILLAAGAVPSITILGTLLLSDPRSSRVALWTMPGLLIAALGMVLIGWAF